jgi:hypothetical protein
MLKLVACFLLMPVASAGETTSKPESTILSEASETSGTPAVASPRPLSPVKQAEGLLDGLSEKTPWREVDLVQERLVALGDDAIPAIRRHARKSNYAVIRFWCYELLTKHFPNESAEIIASDGLKDESHKVLYHCAWHVGDKKIYGAYHKLRRLAEDQEQPEYVRDAATKSLAQLGEPDVMPQLVAMMQHKGYMRRYMGNLGAEALTGKCLNDFNDYDYSEGAFVSGGHEYMRMDEHPATYHERIAKRHQALTDYCVWLEKEKPEIFKYLHAPW